MKRWLRAVGLWLDARLKVRETVGPMLAHPIPKGAAGPVGWSRVTRRLSKASP